MVSTLPSLTLVTPRAVHSSTLSTVESCWTSRWTRRPETSKRYGTGALIPRDAKIRVTFRIRELEE